MISINLYNNNEKHCLIEQNLTSQHEFEMTSQNDLKSQSLLPLINEVGKINKSAIAKGFEFEKSSTQETLVRKSQKSNKSDGKKNLNSPNKNGFLLHRKSQNSKNQEMLQALAVREFQNLLETQAQMTVEEFFKFCDDK